MSLLGLNGLRQALSSWVRIVRETSPPPQSARQLSERPPETLQFETPAEKPQHHPRRSALSSRQVFSLIIKFRSFIGDLA